MGGREGTSSVNQTHDLHGCPCKRMEKGIFTRFPVRHNLYGFSDLIETNVLHYRSS